MKTGSCANEADAADFTWRPDYRKWLHGVLDSVFAWPFRLVDHRCIQLKRFPDRVRFAVEQIGFRLQPAKHASWMAPQRVLDESQLGLFY
jgi:hypothetical protein